MKSKKNNKSIYVLQDAYGMFMPKGFDYKSFANYYKIIINAKDVVLNLYNKNGNKKVNIDVIQNHYDTYLSNSCYQLIHYNRSALKEHRIIYDYYHKDALNESYNTIDDKVVVTNVRQFSKLITTYKSPYDLNAIINQLKGIDVLTVNDILSKIDFTAYYGFKDKDEYNINALYEYLCGLKVVELSIAENQSICEWKYKGKKIEYILNKKRTKACTVCGMVMSNIPFAYIKLYKSRLTICVYCAKHIYETLNNSLNTLPADFRKAVEKERAINKLKNI